MKYSELINRLYNLKKFGIKLGLENIKELLRPLDNPHEGLKFIHVGGTKGKGSVSAMIASVLQEAGYKVGLFTSPHLHRFTERIKINGKEISKKDVVRLAKEILVLSRKMSKSDKFYHPTFFEVCTAMALKYFAENKVDFTVLEVGLGGRLDATNIVRPLVSVITNIDFDHMHILGKTLTKIAKEKAGIIKENSVVVAAENKKEPFRIIKKKCDSTNSKLISVAKNYIYKKISSDLTSQKIYVKGIVADYRINLHLLGNYQLINAATAIAAMEALRDYNIFISKRIIEKGLEKTTWPGRFEILQKKPLVIVDCAHNPVSIKALFNTIKDIDYNRLFIVIGVSSDKNIKKMIKSILLPVDKFIITKARYRGMDTENIKDEVEKTKQPFIIKNKVKNAAKAALALADKKDMVCITGSIFVVDEARRLWKNTNPDPRRE